MRFKRIFSTDVEKKARDMSRTKKRENKNKLPLEFLLFDTCMRVLFFENHVSWNVNFVHSTTVAKNAKYLSQLTDSRDVYI